MWSGNFSMPCRVRGRVDRWAGWACRRARAAGGGRGRKSGCSAVLGAGGRYRRGDDAGDDDGWRGQTSDKRRGGRGARGRQAKTSRTRKKKRISLDGTVAWLSGGRGARVGRRRGRVGNGKKKDEETKTRGLKAVGPSRKARPTQSKCLLLPWPHPDKWQAGASRGGAFRVWAVFSAVRASGACISGRLCPVFPGCHPL